MSKEKHGLGKFIAGAMIGAGMGVLFAPKKGSETRKELKKKTDELVDTIKHLEKDEIKEKLNAKVKELKQDLENLNKETALEMIKEKGSLLMKKADELMDVAKEKSAPVIEKAAKDVKDKTVVVLKKAIDKLEDNKKGEDVANDVGKSTSKKKTTSSKTTKKKTA